MEDELNQNIQDLNIDLNDVHGLEFSDAPMDKAGLRHDKKIVVNDPDLGPKRTSNLMYGYDSSGVNLNGEFISWDEVENAVYDYFASNKDNVQVKCKKTGKTVSPLEMLDEINKRATNKYGVVEVNPDNKIQNQESKDISYTAINKEKTKRHGILMLGNKGINLPCGEYLKAEEIERALNDYVVVSDKKKDNDSISSFDNVNKQKNKKHKILYRRIMDKVIAGLLTGVAALTLLAAMVGFNDAYNTLVNYNVLPMAQVYELSDEDQLLVSSQYNTGDDIYMSEGITYNNSSDLVGPSEQFGNELRGEGIYSLDYISILHNGEIIRVEYEKGANLGDVLQDEANKLGCSVDELKPMIHVGNQVSGWVDFYDLMDSYINNGDIPDVLIENNSLKGTCDFADIIQIDNGFGGIVSIKIVDDNGNLLLPGSKVIGSDGCEYLINDLSCKEEKEVINGVEQKEIDFGFKNLEASEVLTACSFALASVLARKGKKDYLNMTDEELEETKEIIDKLRDNKIYKEKSYSSSVLDGKPDETFNNYFQEKGLKRALDYDGITPEELVDMFSVDNTVGDQIKKIEGDNLSKNR